MLFNFIKNLTKNSPVLVPKIHTTNFVSIKNGSAIKILNLECKELSEMKYILKLSIFQKETANISNKPL